MHRLFVVLLVGLSLARPAFADDITNQEDQVKQRLAAASASDPNLFRPFGTIEEAILRLRSIRGVGEWTAQYIALRAFREMDAFPASDIGLLRGAATIDGTPSTSTSLLNRAESWRPWRAYAAQHLWAADTSNSSTRRSPHD